MARMLGVSEKTIYRWRTREGLPFIKIESQILYRVSAVEAWLSAREITSTNLEAAR
jgi:excisionase family DNA binding protein